MMSFWAKNGPKCKENTQKMHKACLLCWLNRLNMCRQSPKIDNFGPAIPQKMTRMDPCTPKYGKSGSSWHWFFCGYPDIWTTGKTHGFGSTSHVGGALIFHKIGLLYRQWRPVPFFWGFGPWNPPQSAGQCSGKPHNAYTYSTELPNAFCDHMVPIPTLKSNCLGF